MTGDSSIRPRVVTELIGTRVEALVEKQGPLHDETRKLIGRIVTVGIGDDNAIVVQIECDDGWIHTTTEFRRLL